MSQPLPKTIRKMTKQIPGKSKGLRSIRNARLYLQLLAVPRKAPNKKFVIFGQGRSGSTLLVDLLNSSPEVQCDEEILSDKVSFPRLYVKARSMKSKKPIYGFKVKIYQLTRWQKLKDPKRFIVDMHKQGWKIIYLKRNDILRQAVSSIVAEHRGAFHQKASHGPLKLDKIHIDCKDLIERIEGREKFLRGEEKVLEGLPYITVVYEEDLLKPENHQRTLDRLFDYLGTPRVPVSTQLARTSKSKLSDTIENYEELLQALAGTNYAHALSGE